jgi:hypothetical protein
MSKKALIKALRDTAQSASNTVATTVSGPVDLIAMGLRKVGLPIPKNAVGGSEWMAQQGLTAPVEQGSAQVIGDTLGMVSPMVIAAKAPQIASALLQGQRNLAAPRMLNNQAGAIVWHGSPHKFDKFDSSKIGTGEGAQAYGHGLYLAESPDVAKSYQNALTHSDNYVDGELLDSNIPKHFLAKVLNEESGDVLAAKESLEMFARPGGSKSVADSAKKAIQMLESGQRPIMQTIKPEGSIYKVDLPDEQIAKMLDWDKPLSQQSKEVQAAIGLDKNPNAAIKNMTGMEFYIGTGGKLGVPTSASLEAAQHLSKKGITGIRYLDGGSRGAGQGSSNFVVFPGNENMLQILERNGKPLGLMGVK